MNTVLKASLFVVWVAALAGLYFANAYLTKTAESTRDLKATIEADQKTLENYQLLKVKVDELKDIKKTASEILPTEEDQAVIIAELSAFAKRSQIETGELSFVDKGSSKAATAPSGAKKSTKNSPKGVSVVPITFTIKDEASYRNVLDFLNLIEENRRKMQVTQVSLTPDGDRKEFVKDVAIGINLFVKEKAKKDEK